MNFDKLVSLYEAKGTKPGERLFATQNREGPAGVVSGPVGKVDNFEKRQPLNRWEYNASEDTGKSGFAEQTQLWRSMLNSFGLLFNDPDFDKRVQKIAKTFNDNRDSYKLIGGLDDIDEKTGKVKKYDEENKLENLERNKSSYQSKVTGLEQEIKTKTKILNYTRLVPSEKNELELRIAQLESSIPVLNKHIKTAKNEKGKEKYRVQLDDTANRLNRLRDKLDGANMKSSDIATLKSSLFDLDDKLASYKEKLETTTEELEALYDRTNKINENNEKSNEVALEAFKNYVKFTAEQLIIDLEGGLNTKKSLTSLDQLNWEELPQDTPKKLEMLRALASEDPNVNPILGYLQQFERNYADKDYDIRELDKNVNITKMRDFNRLPFMVILRIYNSIRSNNKKPIPIDNLDVDKHKFYQSQLTSDLKGIKSQEEWESPMTKSRLKAAIANLEVSQANKDALNADVDKPWVINRRGLTANQAIKTRMDSMSKDKGLKNESFDVFSSKILNSLTINDDDYILDLVETLSYLKK